MAAHRAARDRELGRDLRRRACLRQELQDLLLARRELAGGVRVGRLLRGLGIARHVDASAGDHRERVEERLGVARLAHVRASARLERDLGFSTTAAQTCSGFSSTSGTTVLGVLGSSATSGGDRWTAHLGFSQPCANAAALGCFQIDTSIEPRGFLPGPRIADEGTRIFVSSVSFNGSVGRATMDAQCAVDASAAGLPGTYLALVGTSASAPLSRFPRPFPWVRVDGWTVIQRIEETDAFAPAILRADGTRPTSLELRAWTGSGARLDAIGSTCSDWTSAGSGVAGASGDVTGQFDWAGSAPPSCNTSHPVYCVRSS